MTDAVTDAVFTSVVKQIQEQKGSRRAYAKMAGERAWRLMVTEDLARLIGEWDSLYIGTASADGQPYHPAPRWHDFGAAA